MKQLKSMTKLTFFASVLWIFVLHFNKLVSVKLQTSKQVIFFKLLKALKIRKTLYAGLSVYVIKIFVGFWKTI